MSRIGLCGGTWQAFSPTFDAQRTINWMPVANGPDAVSAVGMIDRPGTKKFTSDLTGTQNRAQFPYSNTNRHFSIAGTELREVFADGSTIKRGTVANDGLPATIHANNAFQLFICSGGSAYWYDLNTNLLTELATDGSVFRAPVIMGAFCKSFFLALMTDGTFQVSAANDGSTWDPSNVAEPEFSEKAIALFVDHDEVFIMGPTRGEVWWAVGDTFPFSAAPGGVITQGIVGSWAWAQADNSTFIIARDKNGEAIASRFNAYTPGRISHQGIEYTLQKLGTVSQAICWACQISGATLFLIQCPNSETTLVYDVLTGLWSEWSFHNAEVVPDGRQLFRANNHAFQFGKHLIGDNQSGNLYEMALGQWNGASWDFCTDDGMPRVVERITPHISNEQQRVYHSELQIHLEAGLGPLPGLTGGTPAGPHSIILADAVGGLWQLVIGDDGAYVATLVLTGTPQALILNDTLGATSWRINVNGGILSKTAVAYSPAYPQVFDLATPGNKQGILTITAGIIGTDAPAVPRGPQLYLQWSDDAHRFNDGLTLDCGQAGKWKTRVRRMRLGTSRDRVYKISGSDPVPYRIADAYLEASPGFEKPVERMAARVRKMA